MAAWVFKKDGVKIHFYKCEWFKYCMLLFISGILSKILTCLRPATWEVFALSGPCMSRGIQIPSFCRSAAECTLGSGSLVERDHLQEMASSFSLSPCLLPAVTWTDLGPNYPVVSAICSFEPSNMAWMFWKCDVKHTSPLTYGCLALCLSEEKGEKGGCGTRVNHGKVLFSPLY